jgi:FKBP-type peptidyl-prolyl cis-trans isomerase FkpA
MKNLREFCLPGLLVSLILLSVSCKKFPTADQLIENEQIALKKYLISHNITVKPTADSLYYIPSDTGTGIKPGITDIIVFNYSLRLENDKVIATNIDSVAMKSGIYQTGSIYYRPLEYRLSWWFSGLQEGFQLMREGGKATFIIPSQLAYGSAGLPALSIGGYTTVIFDIQLIRVIHDPIADEKAQIVKYVQDSIPANKTFDINDSGVYHIIDIAGTGNPPIAGNTITMAYVAKFLDGTIIDEATTALPYTFAFESTGIIPGMYQALGEMKKGESAWIIIPYKQAYGEQPTTANLPPFSTLVYYISMINIQ